MIQELSISLSLMMNLVIPSQLPVVESCHTLRLADKEKAGLGWQEPKLCHLYSHIGTGSNIISYS